VSRRTRRILALVTAAAVVLVAFGGAFVWTSWNGRGGRAPTGERRVVEAPDGRDIVYYVQRPAGRAAVGLPVVMLASFARSVADLNELADALVDAGYETLAIESRGIGGSGGGGPGRSITLHDLAADIAAVLDEDRDGRRPRAHLIGHAFGNRVVRTFARDHPDRVASLALVASVGLRPIAPEILRALQTTVAGHLSRARRLPSLRLAFFSDRSEIPEHWIGGWYLWGGLAQGAATASTPSEDFWDGGSAPMLVLQAEDDTLAPAKDAGLPLAAAFPDRVELVMIPDAGHAFLPEQPERVRDAIVAFYARF
jgi:pimeloyl-ACP methyl ester carboxylesterase